MEQDEEPIPQIQIKLQKQPLTMQYELKNLQTTFTETAHHIILASQQE